MTRPSYAKTARHLNYALDTIADPSTAPERRAILEAKAEHLRRQLDGRCDTCGRTLHDPESLARGRGPECLRKLTRAA